MHKNFYVVKFIGNNSFADEFKEFAKSDPENIQIESESYEKDPMSLGFDLTNLSAIVGIISATLYAGELATKLISFLRKSKSNKIILQTPFKTIELYNSEKITEDDARKVLKAMQDLN